MAIALSAHLGLAGDYNALHPSARCEFDNGITAGVYYNSERRVSAFLGYRWEGPHAWAELGLATGYSDAPVVPFGRIGVKLTENLSAFAAPAYEVWDGQERLGLVIGTEWRF